MSTSTRTTAGALTSARVRHPLDPLTAEEIQRAIALLRVEHHLGDKVRFETVVLNEPPKQAVLAFKESDPIPRDAFIVVLDNTDGATYEAIVSLTQGIVVSWRHVPDVPTQDHA